MDFPASVSTSSNLVHRSGRSHCAGRRPGRRLDGPNDRGRQPCSCRSSKAGPATRRRSSSTASGGSETYVPVRSVTSASPRASPPTGAPIAIVRFEDEASARANAERPEQTAWFEGMAKLYDGEPTFTESSDVTEWMGGGSERRRVRPGDEVHRRRSCPGREDGRGVRAVRRPAARLLGGLRIWTGPDSCIDVAYFTSEEEARKGEQAEMPDEMKELMSEFRGHGRDRVPRPHRPAAALSRGRVIRTRALLPYCIVSGSMALGYGSIYTLLADLRDRFGFTGTQLGSSSPRASSPASSPSSSSPAMPTAATSRRWCAAVSSSPDSR